MLTLYYFPGACSTAVHVALEETAAPYERRLVDLRGGEQRGEAFQRVNPRGQVPVLTDDGLVLTECAAILTYLGLRFPESGLLPADLPGQGRCLALLAWIAAQVDPVYRRAARPERIVPDAAAQPAIKEAATATFWAKCQDIDRLLVDRPWLAGDAVSACDLYALVYYGWGLRIGLPMAELAGYTALARRLLDRPAVRRALEHEQHPLLAATFR